MAYILTVGEAFHSGESGDNTCEKLSGLVTVDATAGRRQSGSYGFKHDLTAAGNASIVASDVGRITVASGFAGLSAAPTAAFALWGRRVGSFVYDHVQVGTDRKLRVYDKTGTRRGPDGVGITLPTTGGQEWHVVFDGLTLSTVYVKVYNGASEVEAFDTGLAVEDFFEWSGGKSFFGDPAVPGGSVGAILYTDDNVTRFSSIAGDAPHLVAYPRLRGLGGRAQLPTAVGALDGWSPIPAADKWENVDDTPPHDGDTTRLETFNKAAAQLLKSGSANPLPNPVTIHWVQLRDVGKLTADKLGAHFMVRRAGVDAESATGNDAGPTSSYSGGLWPTVTRPGGGAWVRGDADPNVVEFGWMSENNPSFDTGAVVTYQPGPEWIHHTATLPLGTTPVSAPSGDRRRGVGQIV